jgi:hypothetical protein
MRRDGSESRPVEVEWEVTLYWRPPMLGWGDLYDRHSWPAPLFCPRLLWPTGLEGPLGKKLSLWAPENGLQPQPPDEKLGRQWPDAKRSSGQVEPFEEKCVQRRDLF